MQRGGMYHASQGQRRGPWGVLHEPKHCMIRRDPLSRPPRRLQEGPRLASFVTWALPRAAGVRELTVRFTNHHQAMKFQVGTPVLITS